MLYLEYGGAEGECAFASKRPQQQMFTSSFTSPAWMACCGRATSMLLSSNQSTIFASRRLLFTSRLWEVSIGILSPTFKCISAKEEGDETERDASALVEGGAAATLGCEGEASIGSYSAKKGIAITSPGSIRRRKYPVLPGLLRPVHGFVGTADHCALLLMARARGDAGTEGDQQGLIGVQTGSYRQVMLQPAYYRDPSFDPGIGQ